MIDRVDNFLFIRAEHERHMPTCPFVRGEPTQNVPIQVTYSSQPAIAAETRHEVGESGNIFVNFRIKYFDFFQFFSKTMISSHQIFPAFRSFRHIGLRLRRHFDSTR